MILDPFDLTVRGVRSIRVYRAVCEAEYQQWQQSRRFEVAVNSVAGKWFALSREDAAAWGAVVCGEVWRGSRENHYREGSRRPVQSFGPTYVKLDGIGPATFAPIELLRGQEFDEVEVMQ